MPYIKPETRPQYNKIINKTFDSICVNWTDKFPSGDLNYIISSVIWALFDEEPSYSLGNNLVGVLECIKQEFIRRKLNPYEDMKISDNGDL